MKIKTMLFLNIARDFSKYPGGRFRDDGDFSAERLRDELLVPHLRSHSRITVQLDGTLGYGGSFLRNASAVWFAFTATRPIRSETCYDLKRETTC